jgi:hypothetical protein
MGGCGGVSGQVRAVQHFALQAPEIHCDYWQPHDYWLPGAGAPLLAV